MFEITFFVAEWLSSLDLSMLIYQLLPYSLYILMFQKYPLQGPLWTALDGGEGVSILQKVLIFLTLDQKYFFATNL